MLRSIPEILRHINTRLSVYDCIALATLTLGLAISAIFLHEMKLKAKLPVLYKTSGAEVLGATSDARAFGSKNGTTYTYSWCQGSSQIKEANKIYFPSTEAAENTGRRLSKLCQK